MSERNKTVLLQANAAITAGDHEGFLAHCTEDVVWVFVGDRTLQGKAAVRAYMKATYLKPPTFKVDRLVASDETVAAIGDIQLTDENGTVRQYRYCDVWQLREGKLAVLEAFVVEMKTSS